jgi:probable rRNA maturation factor
VSLLRQAAEHVLLKHGLGGDVSIMLTDDAEIQRLNGEFRALEEPTDVLTFPAPDDLHDVLGDIAVSVEYAERQAQARGIHLNEELAYLVIHGALHLTGLDDESPEERQAMMAAMADAGKELGLPPESAWTSLLHAEADEGDAA